MVGATKKNFIVWLYPENVVREFIYVHLALQLASRALYSVAVAGRTGHAFEAHKHNRPDRKGRSIKASGDHLRHSQKLLSNHRSAEAIKKTSGHIASHHELGLDEEDFFPTHSTLSGKVLVLNGNYEPLAICSVEKAIVLLYLDKAELVSAMTGRAVHSTSISMPFPSVVRLATYIHVPFKKVILSRKNILRRDGHRCQYCGATAVTLTVDHIMPKSRGGEDSWGNLVSACLRCNNRKGSQTPDEAEMPLMRRPIRPNHVTFLRQFIGRIDKDWEPYLFMR